MSAPYSYSGLEAESYDSVDELSDFEDYPFYRFLIEGRRGPVLDLGCGTGRILERLAGEGVEIVGLDSSSEMLEICRRKLKSEQKIRLERGDIREFDLKEAFDTVLIPGFTFQLLLEDADVAACLDCCRRHLLPGGQLVVPLYMPWEMLESGKDRSPLEKCRESEPDSKGVRFVAWQGWEIDRERQWLKLLNRFQRLNGQDGVLADERREMSLRWYLPYEMQQRLSECGFEEVAVYSDFEFGDPDPHAESYIFVASASGE